MRSESGEVAAFGLGSLMQRVADTRIPKRLLGRALLVENPCFRFGAVVGRLLAETLDQISDAQDTAAVLTLWAADVLMPDTLFDFDCCAVEVYVLPLQPEHLGDPRAGSNAGFDYQQ